MYCSGKTVQQKQTDGLSKAENRALSGGGGGGSVTITVDFHFRRAEHAKLVCFPSKSPIAVSLVTHIPK